MSQNVAPPPPPRTAQPRSFPLWIIPLGCSALVLIIIGFIAGVFTLTMTIIKSSGAYENAMEVAQSHPTVIEVTGEPVEVGWFVTGNVQVNGATGKANLSIPVSGPNGHGTVHVAATKNGEWYFDHLTFADAEGGPPLELLE